MTKEKIIRSAKDAGIALEVVCKILHQAGYKHLDLSEALFGVEICLNNIVDYLGGNQEAHAIVKTKMEWWDIEGFDGLYIRYIGSVLTHHGRMLHEDRVPEDREVINAVISLLHTKGGKLLAEEDIHIIRELSDKADDARTEKHNERNEKLKEKFSEPSEDGLYEKLLSLIRMKGKHSEIE